MYMYMYICICIVYMYMYRIYIYISIYLYIHTYIFLMLTTPMVNGGVHSHSGCREKIPKHVGEIPAFVGQMCNQ
jgi:hypothetical protein